jgi:hypothetical protein
MKRNRLAALVVLFGMLSGLNLTPATAQSSDGPTVTVEGLVFFAGGVARLTLTGFEECVGENVNVGFISPDQRDSGNPSPTFFASTSVIVQDATNIAVDVQVPDEQGLFRAMYGAAAGPCLGSQSPVATPSTVSLTHGDPPHEGTPAPPETGSGNVTPRTSSATTLAALLIALGGGSLLLVRRLFL